MKFEPSLFLGLCVSALACASLPAQAGVFNNIRLSSQSNSCLDNATENDAKLQIWSCDDGADEKWTYVSNAATAVYTIVNRNTGRCIAGPASGAGQVTVQPCDLAQPSQQWYPYYFDYASSTVVWQSRATNLCLVANSVKKGGTLLTQACNASYAYQRWTRQ